jgi:hypothetical protein
MIIRHIIGTGDYIHILGSARLTRRRKKYNFEDGVICFFPIQQMPLMYVIVPLFICSRYNFSRITFMTSRLYI